MAVFYTNRCRTPALNNRNKYAALSGVLCIQIGVEPTKRENRTLRFSASKTGSKHCVAFEFLMVAVNCVALNALDTSFLRSQYNTIAFVLYKGN